MIRIASEEYLKTDRTFLFKELTERLKQSGCFDEKKPMFYMQRLAWYLLVHTTMLWFISMTSHAGWCFLWVSVDAVFILRLGFIGHDLAHGAVAPSVFYKDYLGEIVWAFFLGLSKEFWDKKHTLHHKYTNISANAGDDELKGDPDIETPPFILGEPQNKLCTNKWAYTLVRYQYITYWLALTLLVIGLSIESLIFLIQEKFKNRSFAIRSNKGVVISLIVSGYIVNNIPLFLGKTWEIGLLLLTYKYMVAGFIIGLVFALNHVGLPVVSGLYPIDRLTLQTYTSRNISGRCGRWFWGVLAYQTEHHLWPGISWHKLPEVAKVTQEFCQEHGIVYNEESPVRCFLDSTAVLKTLSKQVTLDTERHFLRGG